MQNFMSIGKAPAEKSVTLHTYKKEINGKLIIQPYSVYGETKTNKCSAQINLEKSLDGWLVSEVCGG